MGMSEQKVAQGRRLKGPVKNGLGQMKRFGGPVFAKSTTRANPSAIAKIAATPAAILLHHALH